MQISVHQSITEPAILAISSVFTNATCPNEPDGSITLTITGGTQPYNAIWADGASTPDRLNIPQGTYSVVITDLNGCAASSDIVVGFDGSEDCIEISQVITPNNDGFNDTWKIKNIDLFPNAYLSLQDGGNLSLTPKTFLQMNGMELLKELYYQLTHTIICFTSITDPCQRQVL